MVPRLSEAHAHLNRLASVWMERGIILLNGNGPEALHGAMRCFDTAIDIRQRLPESAGFRYCLAAGWINRGDALARLGGPENLAEAVRSHTTAIEVLKDPPPDDDGTYAGRLAIAWINRGIALEKQAAPAQALRSYKEAVRLLSPLYRAAEGKLDLVFASAWINLGNASLRSGGKALAEEAREAAEQALALLAVSESKELAAAEAGLKARHVLSQSITVSLGETFHNVSVEPDLIGKLTDAVEGALNLVQSWEEAGVACFRPMATQFFHLGTLAYENHQSHFLPEFLGDHLEREWVKSPLREVWFAIAEASLSRVRCGLRNINFASLATPRGIRQLEILKEVRAAEESIRDLRGSRELCYSPSPTS